MLLILNRSKFDNIVSYFSDIYRMTRCEPSEDRSFGVELFAVFEDGDYTIIADAPKKDHELIIHYYAPKYSNRNYKPKK